MNKMFNIILCAAVLLLTGCQVLSGDRSVQQYSSDSATTANVKAELLNDARVNSLPIHVETDKGTVVLTGFVKNHEQKISASHAARLAKGVREVRNNIIVRP